jgi:hypothetical protein
METVKLTLRAVRITENSAFVIGTERRSLVFCTLFTTAAKEKKNGAFPRRTNQYTKKV